MGLYRLLQEHQTTIIKRWFAEAARPYQADYIKFLKSNPDPFANPVGSNTRRCVTILFEELIGPADRPRMVTALDPVIRIRAVQNLTPSQAIGFIPSLKPIVRRTLKKPIDDEGPAQQWPDFDGRVDGLTLMAFDLYMQCREKIYELKTNTERNKIYRAFERAGLIDDNPEPAASGTESTNLTILKQVPRDG